MNILFRRLNFGTTNEELGFEEFCEVYCTKGIIGDRPPILCALYSKN